MLKRVVSTLLVLCMVLTTLPVTALAAGPTEITTAGGDLASGTYQLNGNVTLEKRLIVRPGVNATIDLNGYTLGYACSGFPADYSAATMEAILVQEGASLTITDSSPSQNGAVSFVYTGTSQGTNKAVNTITNKGTLIVDAGRIENLTSVADNQCGYAIDNRPDGDESVTCIINGGTISAAHEELNYCAIRQFARSEIGTVDVIINGGNVGMLWLQNRDDSIDANAKTVIENGVVSNVYLEASNNFAVAVNGGNIGTITYFGSEDGTRYPQGFIHGGTVGSLDVGSTGLSEDVMLAADSGMIVDGDGNITVPAFRVEYYESQNEAWNAGVPDAEPYTLRVLFDTAFPAGYYLWFQITGPNHYGIATGETDGITTNHSMSFLNKDQWESWPSESVLPGAPAAGTYEVTVWASKTMLDQTNFTTGTPIGTASIEIGETACVISYRNAAGELRADVTVAAGSTISLELNGGVWYDGSMYSPVVVTVNDSLTLAEPTKSGYTFAGWNVTTDANGPVFTATWEEIDYVVTFDANGGEGEMAPQYFVAGVGEALQANTFTKAGSAFIGWNTAADGSGTLYADEQVLTFADVDSNIVLYAQWSTNTYPFTYVKFIGTKQEPIETTMNITYGVEVTVDLDGGTYYGKTGTYTGIITEDEGSRILTGEAEKPGYTFKGWQYTADTKTFKAMWTRDAHQITYMVDGTVYWLRPVEALEEVDPSAVTAPSKTGAEFTGWYFDEAATQPCGTSLVVEGNITLYAGWKTNLYTVTFKYDDGVTADSTDDVYYGTTVAEPEEPTREGYVFKGWYDENGYYDFTQPVTDDLTLYADWEEITSTITLNANGGVFTGKNDQEIYVTGEKTYSDSTAVDDLTAKLEPTRAGYTFVGWSLDGSKSTDYRPGGTIQWKDVIASGATLYAVWKTDSYTVTFNYNDSITADSTVSVYYGKTVAEPEEPTREGYVFNGWYQDGISGYYDFTQPVTGNLTLYASWTEITATITLNANGGVFTVNNQEVYETEKAYSDSAAVDALTDALEPTREGYTFAGWSLDGSKSTDYRPGGTIQWKDVIASGATLYAVWKTDSYTVTFNYNDSITKDDTVSVYYGKTVAEPEEPIREGYTFNGWYQDGISGYYDFTQPVTEDLTLYASWTEKSTVITVDANGGLLNGKASYTMKPKNYSDSIAVKQILVPERAGYDFLGWATTADATEAQYVEGGKIQCGDLIDNNVTTLYAVWKISDMEIGTNADTVDYYTVGDTFTVTVLAAPDQDLELTYKAANKALKLVQDLTEGTDGVYTAVFEVKSITANEITPVFTVTNAAYDASVSCEATLQLRKEVIVIVTNADGTVPSLESMQLKDNADSIRSIAFTYDDATQSYVALADRSGWDYITFTTADGRQVELTETTKVGQTIADAINETDDGTIYVTYTFGDYTVIGNLYINDAPVSGVALRVSGNYGDAFEPWMLYNQATAPIAERYPNAIQDEYNFAITDASGADIYLHNFGEAVIDWGPENTIYVNIYATVGYYVQFDRADGSADSILEIQFVKHGAQATQPADPILNGFGFTGWYTDEACTNLYDFTSPVEQSITLYAGWTRDAYVVTFHTGYGEAYGADTPQAPQTVAYEGTVTKPADPERPGFAFEGWYADADYTQAWDFANHKVVGNTTLYAKWTAVKYQLTYHLGLGDVTNVEAFATQDIYYEDQIAEPENPVSASCIFQGWYTDEAYNVPAEFPISVTGNVDLYAKWSVKEYVVSFNANGGYMTVDAITVAHGETGGDQWPEAPVCAGYTFEGWYLDANNNGSLEEEELSGLVDSTTPVRSDLSLIARWTQDEYTVTFNAAGGTVNPASQTVHYGETITEPEVTYGGEDTYLFAGWYTDSTFTTLWNFEDGVTGDMELVAKWDKAYTVTFDLNGGVMPEGIDVPAEIVVAEGDTIPVPAEPSRGAYVLVGWFTEEGKWNTPWNFETDVVTSDLTLTAGWAHAVGNGTFFDTTATQTFVRIQVADADGNLRPASGIADLKLSAVDEAGNVIFENVQMTELTNVPADWDKNYAYYTATYDRLTKKGMFQLTAEEYVFNVVVE